MFGLYDSGCQFGGAVGGEYSNKCISFGNVPKQSSFLGAQGGSKITKAHLSETCEMFETVLFLKVPNGCFM